jgi:hypothetical protein
MKASNGEGRRILLPEHDQTLMTVNTEDTPCVMTVGHFTNLFTTGSKRETKQIIYLGAS